VVQAAGNAAQGGQPAAAFADEVDTARSGDGHGKARRDPERAANGRMGLTVARSRSRYQAHPVDCEPRPPPGRATLPGRGFEDRPNVWLAFEALFTREASAVLGISGVAPSRGLLGADAGEPCNLPNDQAVLRLVLGHRFTAAESNTSPPVTRGFRILELDGSAKAASRLQPGRSLTPWVDAGL
jgi:hypothetical protein